MTPDRKFNVGDKVTYKSKDQFPDGKYEYGGVNQGGYVGKITSYLDFQPSKDCWKISVTTSNGCDFNMLESEFEEYDSDSTLRYDPILNEAKARYPMGTCFIPVHISPFGTEHCIITEDSCIKRVGDKIYSVVNDELYSYNDKYGTTPANRMIYCEKEGWAKIIGNILIDPEFTKGYYKPSLCSEIELPDSEEKPLIEPVHSVSVQLRTSKKSKQLTI